MKTWQSLAVGILLGALTITGAFQLTLAGEVKTNVAEIRSVREQIRVIERSNKDLN